MRSRCPPNPPRPREQCSPCKVSRRWSSCWTTSSSHAAFSDQLALLPRKQDPERLRQALAALCENNTLPQTAVAAAAGMPPTRARGYAAVLTQLLNMDGIQVLELLPDNKTLKLNPAWLRAQFGLGE